MSIYSNPEKHIAEAIAAHNESLKESLNSIKITNADRFLFGNENSYLIPLFSACIWLCRKKTTSRSTRKGQFGADLAEDEDWVERLKQVCRSSPSVLCVRTYRSMFTYMTCRRKHRS